MFSQTTFRQAQSSYTVWIISILYGLERGWTGPALKILILPNSPFPITTNQIILLSVVSTIGNIVGILVCGYMGRSIGRKPLLATVTVLLSISWTVTSVATTFEGLLCGKFLINLALGLFDVIYCIYISEITTSRNRGTFIAFSLICFTFGTEIQYVIGLANNFQLLALVPLVISVAGLFCLFFVIESPYYLVSRDFKEEAWKSIAMLNAASNESVANDYEALVRDIEKEKGEKNSILKIITAPENYKICVCMFVMNTLVYLNGVGLLAEYAPIVFLPFESINVDITLNILGIVNMVSTLVSPLVVDRFGRKLLMFAGFMLLAIYQFVITICFYAEKANGYTVPFLPECIVVFAVIAKVVYAISVYPTIHILRGEMFPYKLKESGTCLLMIFKTTLTGVSSAIFFPIADTFGVGFNFLIYSVLALAGGIFVHFFLIETKGKTLLEIKNAYMSM